MPLTEIECKNAKSKAKPYKKSDGGGLYLEVMPNGSKYWRLKYRFNGKEKRLALGVYVDRAHTLAKARQERDRAKAFLAEGKDPSSAKQDRKRQLKLNANNTFEAVAREWHKQKDQWSPRYSANVLHRLEIDIFPHVGGRPITDVTVPTLVEAFQEIQDRGARELARRAMQTCSQIFSYAKSKGYIEYNPISDVKGKDVLKPVIRKHFAALDSKDIPVFLMALHTNEARLYQQTRNAIKLLMLTFVRTSELINAKWSEFDLDNKLWLIPAERMKMRADHLVPLSRQALAILNEQKQYAGKWDWIFPNQARPKKPMSNNTILKALERMGYKGQMTGHGFRALAMSTIKENLDYRHEIVDRQLAHAPKTKTDKAYDRAAWLPERKKMMQEWSDYLDTVASKQKILPFSKTAQRERIYHRRCHNGHRSH